MSDKIPIGKYYPIEDKRRIDGYVEIKLKHGVNISIGDIITLDMIEPYESEAVRKVAKYMSDHLLLERRTSFDEEYSRIHAEKIVELVHEAEDSDE